MMEDVSLWYEPIPPFCSTYLPLNDGTTTEPIPPPRPPNNGNRHRHRTGVSPFCSPCPPTERWNHYRHRTGVSAPVVYGRRCRMCRSLENEGRFGGEGWL